MILFSKGDRVEVFDETDKKCWRRGTVLDHRKDIRSLLVKLDDQDEPAMFWDHRTSARALNIVERVGEIKLPE